MKNPKRWRRTRAFAYRLLRINPDRTVELVLVILALVFTATQIHITNKNNQSNSDQTNQLIAAAKYSAYAADRNAQAASNFAQSAQAINSGVQDAVTRLQAQAQGTQAIAGASTAQANASRAIANEAAAQSKAASELAATARQQLDTAERPWIDVHLKLGGGTAGSPIWVDDFGGLHVDYQVVARNIGRSPATRLHIASSLAPSVLKKDIATEQARLCAPPSHTADVFLEGEGQTVFPGDEPFEQVENQKIWPSEIREQLAHPSNELYRGSMGLLSLESIPGSVAITDDQKKQLHLTPVPTASIMGCVTYQVDFSGETKHTSFSYEIRGIDFDTLKPGLISLNGVDIRLTPGYGNSAN